MINSSQFRAGDWVQVRSQEEILATLDKNGQLDGLFFMPEMFEFCGQRLRVFKRAHKTCDPPNGMGGRRMLRAVHLEGVRCDGSAHGGCEARCLVFWKDDWLKKVESGAEPQGELAQWPSRNGAKEQDVIAATRRRPQTGHSEEPVYACQSTHLAQATEPIRSWDLSQYAEDYASGNVRLSAMAASFVAFLYNQVVSAGIGLGTFLSWAYDTFQKIRGGTPYPWRSGEVPRNAKTPSAGLGLQSGELIRIRPYREILTTLDEANYNRGMSFDPEMVPFCGDTHRVLGRINKIINERTGKMLHLKNDCIVLDEVVCRACYAKHRRFCPRSIYPYWREIWLERVSDAVQHQ